MKMKGKKMTDMFLKYNQKNRLVVRGKLQKSHTKSLAN